ncbi:MAG: hypothetical protein JSV82_02045, partial [Planctomycetota bacterium]
RVPLTAFGRLRIVPSTDLGNAGPQKGEALNFDWKWSYSAPGLIIWLALILAIMLPKANRNPHILLIFVPLVIVNLLWLAFKKVLGMSSSDVYQFDTLFHSITVGIAVLWLVVNYFEKFRGLVRFLLSFGTIVTVAYLGTLSYSTEFSNEVALFLAFFAFMTTTMLVAITAAGKLCYWQYRPLNLMLWMAMWTLLGGLFTTFGFFIVGIFIMSSGPKPDILEAILMLTFVGLILGLCLYVLNLPFMILGLTNSFFRERFCACLCPKSMPTTAKSDANGDQLNEQSLNPETSENNP